MVFPNLFDRYFESLTRHWKYADAIFCYLIPGARDFFQLLDDVVEHRRFGSFYPRTSRHFRDAQRDSHWIGFVAIIVFPGLREECLLKEFVRERKERWRGMKVK